MPKPSGKPDPTAHLSPDDVEALARELDALRQEVLSSRGAGDAAYIRKVIDVQRKLELGSRAVLLFSRPPRPRGWWARLGSRWPRSSRTWRSATTSCTASDAGNNANYVLTTSGGTVVGTTRNVSMTVNKGPKSQVGASGNVYYFFSANGVRPPPMTQPFTAGADRTSRATPSPAPTPSAAPARTL